VARLSISPLLMAMILQYAMKIGEGMGKGSIKDAVIAVPPYFGQTARYALYDAADIAGLNILAEAGPRTSHYNACLLQR